MLGWLRRTAQFRGCLALLPNRGKRVADVKGLPDLRIKGKYNTCFRRGDLHNRLVGFYFHEWLVFLYLVAFLHRPLYEAALVDPLAHIREVDCFSHSEHYSKALIMAF